MKTLQYIAVLITLGIFASCEDVIDVPLNEQDEDFYTIEAKITTLNNPWVFISKSISVTLDEAQQGISNAVVTITDETDPSQSITLVEHPDSAGYYTFDLNSRWLGKTNHAYTLTIETPEGVEITATETLAPVEPIDSIQVRPSLRGDKRFLGVFTYGQETSGLGNYYKWDVYVNDTLISDAEYLFIVNDEFVDGNYVSSLEILTDFYDLSDEDSRIISYEDTVHVEQISISPFAYEFYYQMYNQATTGFLISVPPANLPSNFTASDGSDVYGIFTASDVSVSNEVVITSEIEDQLDKSDVH